LAEAQAWYESRRAGLGDELLDEVRRAVGLLQTTPNDDRFITVIFAGCSRAVFPANFSIASKATASLFFASCTRNGSISGNFEIRSCISRGSRSICLGAQGKCAAWKITNAD
jgi:hypothetical protein